MGVRHGRSYITMPQDFVAQLFNMVESLNLAWGYDFKDYQDFSLRVNRN